MSSKSKWCSVIGIHKCPLIFELKKTYCKQLAKPGNMLIYSDSKVSDFFDSLTDEQSAGFLNMWNTNRNYRKKTYISYDSTNKNCQAGDVEIVEYGHPKTDCGLPVCNYAIAYDNTNREPLFYEKYPGSIKYVTVPAALKELDKIETVRLLDYAVTATQKTNKIQIPVLCNIHKAGIFRHKICGS